jgi:hypothetical protein
MADYNLAPVFGTVVAYASQYTGKPVTNLIDGHPANYAAVAVGDYTAYRTASATGQWVIIDLGKERPLSAFALWGSASPEDVCVQRYRIALDHNLSGTFSNIVVDDSVNYESYIFGGALKVHRDHHYITPQYARYVKLFLDSNFSPYGVGSYIETIELEIIGTEIQQDTAPFISNSEIYTSPVSVTTTSNAYIIFAPIITSTSAVTSNATITTSTGTVSTLSDALIATNVYSDAYIVAAAVPGVITVQSNAMISRSCLDVRHVFTMGKSSVSSLDTRDLLVYCTDISSSDEVVVADMITSSIMDLATVIPPLGYQNYDWKYDWVVRTYNSAQYRFEIRTGETTQNLLASTFSPIVLGQVISIGQVPKYYQWRCHVWASGSGDFELHQFSIKGYIDYPSSLLYASLNPKIFTTVSKVETGVDKSYEPMDMSNLWGGSYIPGDANSDGVINPADYLYIIAYKYYGGPAPIPIRRADVNDDGSVNILDITYLLTMLTHNGPPPFRRDAGGLE